ncbi:hypothetical protein [Saccharicrinis sp. 156]|uniref:hypothetical protein n=1 Tax=Saccharicrinis sp. 156 TaxID=3417574 RepID=UPI003D34429E
MKTIILLALLFVGFALQAQEAITKSRKSQIGFIYSSLGDNVVSGDALIGGPSYDGDGFFTIGISYLKPLSNWLDLETGIDYSEHKISVSNAPMPGKVYNSRREMSLIHVPVALRAIFLKYFYVNGGMLLGMDISDNSPIDSQGGIGALFGLGAKYDFNNGLGVFVNPYTKFHALLGFGLDNNRKRINESGFRFGVVF